MMMITIRTEVEAIQVVINKEVVVVIVIVIEAITLIVEKEVEAHTEIIINTNSQTAETTTNISLDMKSKNFKMMMFKIM